MAGDVFEPQRAVRVAVAGGYEALHRAGQLEVEPGAVLRRERRLAGQGAPGVDDMDTSR